MKKRLSFLLLVTCLSLVLCACGGTPSTTVVTLPDSDEQLVETNTSQNSISIFSTRDDKEYLEFLTVMGNQYEIIDISTCQATYIYGESYVVTYMPKKDNSTEPITYKYYLFKTRLQSEYVDFYNSFDFDTYEIVDISALLNTYIYAESYMITYRKPI